MMDPGTAEYYMHAPTGKNVGKYRIQGLTGILPVENNYKNACMLHAEHVKKKKKHESTKRLTGNA